MVEYNGNEPETREVAGKTWHINRNPYPRHKRNLRFCYYLSGSSSGDDVWLPGKFVGDTGWYLTGNTDEEVSYSDPVGPFPDFESCVAAHRVIDPSWGAKP